jgi:preprotein translocase subunit SecD
MAKLTLRIWILIIALVLALLTIAPWHALQKGVIIESVETNSTAFNTGLRQGMIIKAINGQQIENIITYSDIILKLFPTNQTNQTTTNQTNQTTQLNQLNLTKLTITTSNSEFIIFTNKPLEITIGSIPKTNLKTGLDLSGGARALVKPENVSLSSQEISDLIAVTNERFNVFGISDITIRAVKDLQGNNYMLVEIAGATTADLKNLVGQQGKFEAKIGNDTAFIGGKKDIASVCRNDATCARIEIPQASPQGGYSSGFQFTVYLSEDAAKSHAAITANLSINNTASGSYLDKPLDLYVDDKLVDSLLISSDLRGRVTTQVSVSGSGTGATQQDAYNNAKQNMNKLQTILITGSLPYKLNIVKLDTISPVLGLQFTKNIIYLGFVAFIIVSVIIFIKYKKIKITLSVILTMFSEAFITLGIAALIKWNLDAPSLAGIIAGIGTGVNDQIVMIDESVSNKNISIKDRIKRAFFIILAAFATIIASMIPLFEAGAGMLRGFALTTILCITIGILVTRPAFADILKKIQS